MSDKLEPVSFMKDPDCPLCGAPPAAEHLETCYLRGLYEEVLRRIQDVHETNTAEIQKVVKNFDERNRLMQEKVDAIPHHIRVLGSVLGDGWSAPPGHGAGHAEKDKHDVGHGLDSDMDATVLRLLVKARRTAILRMENDMYVEAEQICEAALTLQELHERIQDGMDPTTGGRGAEGFGTLFDESRRLAKPINYKGRGA